MIGIDSLLVATRIDFDTRIETWAKAFVAHVSGATQIPKLPQRPFGATVTAHACGTEDPVFGSRLEPSSKA